MKSIFTLTLICLLSALCTTMVQAAPDQYPGDTSIYGSQVVLDPNVLLVIDTSSSMTLTSEDVPGGSYSKSTTYGVTTNCGTDWLSNCSSTEVYQVISQDGKPLVFSDLGTDISHIATSCGGKNPQSLLNTGTNAPGIYTGTKLNSSGTCSSGSGYTYYYGNYINYLFTPGSNMHKIDVVKSVVDNLIKSTTGVRFGVMTYYYPNHTDYTSYSGPWTQYYGKGGTFLSGVPAGTGITATYTTTIKDMDDIFQGTMTNRTALRRIVRTIYPPGTPDVDAADTPLAETLYEAGQYFKGGAPAYGPSTMPGTSGGTYVSPAVPSCRNNYVVFLTDGKSTADTTYSGSPTTAAQLDNTLGALSITGVTCTKGDCDGDGAEPVGNGHDYSHSMDDVAKYLNLGTNTIKTYTIGFGAQVTSTQAAVDLLTRAANTDHGQGAFYPATNQTALATAFSSIIANILAVNSSYVAPVVPVSPDNRTYGGSRVFMGFFKPQDNSAAWLGNLKKYGLDSNNNVTDINGAAATNADGSFKKAAASFWNPHTPYVADGADVNAGGVGALLEAKTNITTSRTIYTTASKSNGASLVALNDSTITTGLLNVADSTTRTNLLNFIYGQDAYTTTDLTVNRSWPMGDVMHSKPLIINYAKYAFSTNNEKLCGTNTSRIFVGANDGMLHAFNDCDGSEMWAFTPYDMLSDLQFIPQTLHSYFVDSTPSVYLYNKLNNGTIDPSTDKVILMFGERRGGGQTLAHRTPPPQMAPIMYWM